MGIYNNPNDFSFVQTYINAAKSRDDRTKQSMDDIIGGTADFIKGTGEAVKFQNRKAIADRAEWLKSKIKELEDERNKIIGSATPSAEENVYGNYGGKPMNFDLYAGMNPLLDTGRI